MKTILATTSSFGHSSKMPVDMLTAHGYALVTNPHGRKLTERELMHLLDKHRPVGLLAGTEPVTAKALNSAQDYLKAVARIGIGWDNVDHDAAKKLGLAVTRTVGVLDQPVAELTMGMILGALRKIPAQDRALRKGIWEKQMGNLLSGKTVAIIGFGAIGRHLSRMLHVFDAKTVCVDTATIQPDLAKQLPLHNALALADIVTIHASGNNCILGTNEIACCKPGVIIVNTARGEMIDETALLKGLKNRHIAHACLDTFNKEPYVGPLTDFDNVTLTPHIGSYAVESRIEMEKVAVINILESLKNNG